MTGRRRSVCTVGEISGTATRLQRALNRAAFQVRIQHAVHDGAHAPVPPEVSLAFGDIGEFRRVHPVMLFDGRRIRLFFVAGLLQPFE